MMSNELKDKLDLCLSDVGAQETPQYDRRKLI